MIKVTEVQQGPHVDWSLQGSVLSIGGDVLIDLEKERRDSQRIIDICKGGNGLLVIGLGNGYVASVLIPPIEYENTTTEDGISKHAPRPMDLDAVELKLWRNV